MPKIAIAIIDINSMHMNAEAFAALSAKEKIDRIEKAITHICSEFAKTYKDSMWVVTWREYGIGESNSNYVDVTIRNELKQRMLALTAKHENLTIIAGTMGVKRHFSNLEYKEELEKVKEDWRQLVLHAEKVGIGERFNQDEQIILHCNKIFEVEKTADAKGIDVVRNTCDIFQKDKIFQYRKTIPSFEIADHMPYAVFSPGTEQPLHTLVHPITKEPVTLGLEICREHAYSVLKDAKLATNPLVHFVVSHSIDIRPENICGSYLIHADGVYQPKTLFTEDRAYPDTITIHQLNLLANLEQKNEAERNKFLLKPEPPEYLLHHMLSYNVPNELKEHLLQELQDDGETNKPKALKEMTDAIMLKYRKMAFKLAQEIKNTINEKRASDGKTALHLAVEKNYGEIVDALFANKANAMQEDDKNVSPILLAVSLKHWEIAAKLLFNSNENDKKKIDILAEKMDLKNLAYIVSKFNLWVRFTDPEAKQCEMLRKLQDENNVLGQLVKKTCYMPSAPTKAMRWIDQIRDEFEDLPEAFHAAAVPVKVEYKK